MLTRALCSYHLLPRGSTPGTPLGEPTGTQVGRYSFGISFFSCEGGELFSFGNDFAGPRGHTHGICSRLCDRQVEKVLYLIPWSMCENEQKVCKKIGYICVLFVPMKSKYYTLV